METMEYSKVGIKDIFKGIADFFKQQVEKEKKDIERQIAEIQAAEDNGYIEQLKTEVETHEIKKAKKTGNISRKQITKTVIEKEQDELEKEQDELEKEQDELEKEQDELEK